VKVRSGMKTMLVTPSSVEGFLRAPSLQVALHLVRWIILFRPSPAAVKPAHKSIGSASLFRASA
jgi:hypothetical protein